jgi:putative phosphoesterase
MRVAVLGDIHANAPALAAVLVAARSHRAEALLLTGDYVGYYYWPAQALDLLEPWDGWRIRGNHDRMLQESMTDPQSKQGYLRKYGSGLEVALTQLSAAQIQSLVALPDKRCIVIDDCRVLLAHGAPWDPDEYIYPNAPAEKWQALAQQDADFVVLGHTHYSMTRQEGGTVVVNPGSVGQPRDRRPGASWALLDTVSRSVTIHVESYDMTGVMDEARRRDPQLPYLHQVLCRV